MSPLDQLCLIPFHDVDESGRARILSRLADTELFVALRAEPVADQADLMLFDLPDGRVALACDAEDRLSGFVAGPVAYLAMPGRVLAATLLAERVGLLVNPGQLSEMMLGPDILDWLARSLDQRPQTAEAVPQRLSPADPALLAGLAGPLAERLADMVGLARAGWLMAAQWRGGETSHLLMIEGAAPEHQPAIAKAVAEMLGFLPDLPDTLDIRFVDRAAGGTVPDFALRIDIPEPAAPEIRVQPVPGADPDKPPRLR